MSKECLQASNYRRSLHALLDHVENSTGSAYLGIAASRDGAPLAHLHISATRHALFVREVILNELAWVDEHGKEEGHEFFDRLAARHGAAAVLPIAAVQLMLEQGVGPKETVDQHLSKVWNDLSSPAYKDTLAMLHSEFPRRQKPLPWWKKILRRGR